MDIAGNYLFFRHDREQLIGLIELLRDGRIRGGSINETTWKSGFSVVQFLNDAGIVTSSFPLHVGIENCEGLFLLPYEGTPWLKHILRKVGTLRKTHSGPLRTIARDLERFRALTAARADFSVVVAPPQKVASKAELTDFSACGSVPDGLRNFLAESYAADEVFFHVLHDAVLYNGSIVETNGGEIIHETAYQCQLRSKGLKYAAYEKGKSIHLPLFDSIVERPGNWFLFNTLIGNYAHFHVQSLVNAGMLDTASKMLDVEKMNMLFVSLPGNSAADHYEHFRKDACGLFDLDIEGMMNPLQADGTAYRFERLIVPSTHMIPLYERFNPYLADILRPKLVTQSTGGRRRLLLSRADVGNTRSITNFDDLSLALAGLGFETVVIGSLSYMDQMALMADAEIVVSPHGGNLTNMLAHPGGLKILELTHSSQLSTWFKNLAAIAGHRYAMICFPPIERNWYSSFEVNIPQVLGAVSMLLQAREE